MPCSGGSSGIVARVSDIFVVGQRSSNKERSVMGTYTHAPYLALLLVPVP